MTVDQFLNQKRRELQTYENEINLPLSDNDSMASLSKILGEESSSSYYELKRVCRKRVVHRNDVIKIREHLLSLVGLSIEVEGSPSVEIEKSADITVDLPPYLKDAINGSTSFNLLDICLDCRISLLDEIRDLFEVLRLGEYSRWREAILRTEVGKQLYETQKAFITSYKDVCAIAEEELLKAISGSGLNDKGGEMIGENVKISDQRLRLLGLHLLSYSELTKRQLLFGVPFTYNMLMEGYHSQHREKEVLSTVTPDDLRAIKLAFDALKEYLIDANISPLAVGEVRLPIGTSQGLLLKSESDSIFFRGFSKFLLSLIASKCRDRAQLHQVLQEIGQEFSYRGYYSPHLDAFLGLRRMHMKPSKVEPFFPDSNLNHVSGVTKLQGRIRAIFPFTEALKFWYKRLCDPVKKHLFSQAGMFSVHPGDISKKQLDIERSFLSSKELVKRFLEKREWMTSYDLSTYDMSCPYYLNELYNNLMRSVVPNGASMWADGHNSAGVLHLKSVLHFTGDGRPDGSTIYKDDVEGRSTLSGQSDVTLKNNIIHGCLLFAYLIEYYDLFKERSVIKRMVRELISNGRTTIGEQIIYAHMHGDDVMFYGSNQERFYDELAQFMTRAGIKTGFEAGPVYLKRVCNPYSPSQLVNIGGSLEKNRLGEYNQKNAITALLSVIDNVQLEQFPGLSSKVSDRLALRQENEWKCFITVLRALYPEGEIEGYDVSELYNTSSIRSANLEGLKLMVSRVLSSVVLRVTPKSIRIRQSLLNEAYKTGSRQDAVLEFIKGSVNVEHDGEEGNLREDFTDASSLADDIFLSYSLNDDTLVGYSEAQNSLLAKLKQSSLDDLVSLAKNIQSYLLDNDGNSPSNDLIRDWINERG